MREALKCGLVRPWQVRRLPLEWLKYKAGRLDMDFIEKAVALLAGIEESDLERIAGTCFDRRIMRDVYPGAARLIRDARERGERVIFASASFRFVIRPLERFFGIDESLACELEFRDGRTTGRLVGRSLLGSKKKDAVQEWLERNGEPAGGVSFYSDSYLDIPTLELCGRPVAVNPDRRLAREAEKKGWEILRFERPGRASGAPGIEA